MFYLCLQFKYPCFLHFNVILDLDFPTLWVYLNMYKIMLIDEKFHYRRFDRFLSIFNTFAIILFKSGVFFTSRSIALFSIYHGAVKLRVLLAKNPHLSHFIPNPSNLSGFLRRITWIYHLWVIVFMAGYLTIYRIFSVDPF